MPYIKKEKRFKIIGDPCQTSGELNFLFTMEINQYIEAKGLSYQTINDIIGALVCCKDEFYRRVVAPYEDKKISENGDVYK